ncbi:Arginine biosynthesis bifunctional protein ArgJ (plasmid) [Pseudoseohaeicola sp. NH-UV-7]|uniref:bifunctional glutamate N-acetyltransferase/amino-acid acetyltransferase ArgJ n=1 Tax=unclassified Sulfitobacter TaxID=196795 RepID=UPI000E0CA4E7|nr:bifunctional glutamate N-acetyltransferase/amino-acid acetyltransferase ArgJ [Sulfitobacter sp. JL08]AXI56554.1 bifunctional ornithine acetyltransferase/N-acetylglutamate synthase [Sulfitobacter sp. JL08]
MAGTPPLSPLAPKTFPKLPVIDGVSFATAAAGIKYAGRTDVMLAVTTPGTAVAGVFTRSSTRSAPVLDCQAKIGTDSSDGAAFLVNSGNANAFTGRHGTDSVSTICNAVAKASAIPAERVFTASTGVIGEPLPHDRIVGVLDELASHLRPDGMQDAARAIMTTDTFPKGAAASCDIGGNTVSIAGIAKGSGMIAPDMATMLVYIFTDAKIQQPELQAIVSELNNATFNCITVDSDTSTSDSVLVAATGASGIDVTGQQVFRDALREVMLDLAHQVVRDGEGATKFVEISVTNATSDTDARIHALSIANSPLVKTAIAGEDANWGRVVMAIGKSGAPADRDKLSIRFGEHIVAENGWVSPNYNEQAASEYMKGQSLSISVDFGIGSGAATVWTCDLTHGYITINGDYRS